MAGFVTLIPYRPNGGEVGDRYRWLWDHVLPRLEALGSPVFVGEPRGAAWSRSQAVNAAAASAGTWEVALVGDCDTVPDPGSIRRAVAWVRDTRGAVRPHKNRTMLSKTGTLVFCQRGPGALSDRSHFDRAHLGGGLLVVHRDAFDAVGGYDESFEGWGYEDSDFNLRLLRHGAWDRLPGSAWHLWHGRGDNRPSPASSAKYRHLLRAYRRDITNWGNGTGIAQPEKVF